MKSTQEICNKIIEKLGSFEAKEATVEFVDLFAKPEVDLFAKPGHSGKMLSREIKIYEMTFNQFKKAAKRGKLIPASGENYEAEKYAKTFITMGYANGYSDQDIAHFYYARFYGWSRRFKTAYNMMLCDSYREGFIDSSMLKNRLFGDE
jgi:hypothetical protein